MDLTFIVHASLHLSERGYDDLSLQSFAVKNQVWIYNRFPSNKSGLTPFKLLTKTWSDHRELLRCHFWCCPVFVLEPKGQNYQKLPKWNQQARMGQFLGFSDEHYSLVENVLNLSTGNIPPQFHLVFDNLFETVIHTKYDDNVLTKFARIYLN